MRALVLGDAGLRFDPAHAEPVAGPGEALVRVTAAGICGTDLELVRGYKGGFRGVLGHEFVGVVETSGGGLAGRRVVGEINVVCGACTTCLAGRRTHCERRGVLGILGRDGAFAERVVVPVGNLHVVPDAVPDDAAVFVEPLAAAARIAEQVPVGPGTRAVVVGDGRLGLLVAQVLAADGASVTALGRHAESLAILARRGIATATDAAAVPRGADLAVDATGSPSELRAALDCVRPQGTVVVKSTCAGDTPRDLDWNRVVVDEVTIVGSRCGPFDRAIDLLVAGAVDVASLVSARYPLERGADAFAHAARPRALKVLVTP
jgi:threonine dehydrogenase-like Zn-dependent dehydrogenase